MSLFLSITNKKRQNPQITARQLSTGQEKKKGGKRGDWEKNENGRNKNGSKIRMGVK